MTTASLVLGIIAAVMSLTTCAPIISYCTCFAVPVIALVGFILGLVGLSGAGPSGKTGATWGIVLNSVSIVIWIVLVILSLVLGFGAGILQAISEQ